MRGTAEGFTSLSSFLEFAGTDALLSLRASLAQLQVLRRAGTEFRTYVNEQKLPRAITAAMVDEECMEAHMQACRQAIEVLEDARDGLADDAAMSQALHACVVTEHLLAVEIRQAQRQLPRACTEQLPPRSREKIAASLEASCRSYLDSTSREFGALAALPPLCESPSPLSAALLHELRSCLGQGELNLRKLQDAMFERHGMGPQAFEALMVDAAMWAAFEFDLARQVPPLSRVMLPRLIDSGNEPLIRAHLEVLGRALGRDIDLDRRALAYVISRLDEPLMDSLAPVPHQLEAAPELAGLVAAFAYPEAAAALNQEAREDVLLRWAHENLEEARAQLLTSEAAQVDSQAGFAALPSEAALLDASEAVRRTEDELRRAHAQAHTSHGASAFLAVSDQPMRFEWERQRAKGLWLACLQPGGHFQPESHRIPQHRIAMYRQFLGATPKMLRRMNEASFALYGCDIKTMGFPRVASSADAAAMVDTLVEAELSEVERLELSVAAEWVGQLKIDLTRLRGISQVTVFFSAAPRNFVLLLPSGATALAIGAPVPLDGARVGYSDGGRTEEMTAGPGRQAIHQVPVLMEALRPRFPDPMARAEAAQATLGCLKRTGRWECALDLRDVPSEVLTDFPSHGLWQVKRLAETEGCDITEVTVMAAIWMRLRPLATAVNEMHSVKQVNVVADQSCHLSGAPSHWQVLRILRTADDLGVSCAVHFGTQVFIDADPFPVEAMLVMRQVPGVGLVRDFDSDSVETASLPAAERQGFRLLFSSSSASQFFFSCIRKLEAGHRTAYADIFSSAFDVTVARHRLPRAMHAAAAAVKRGHPARILVPEAHVLKSDRFDRSWYENFLKNQHFLREKHKREILRFLDGALPDLESAWAPPAAAASAE